MKAQESFRHDPEVKVLLATDAAGEGINLQRAHLMVNYDLPWNPNRIEQRFGRIHRIGQTEVCHLWNLVAEETREGDVYRTLLEKLDAGAQGARRPGLRRARQSCIRRPAAARTADRGDPLRRPAGSAGAADAGRRECLRPRRSCRTLLEERALAHDAMDASRVFRIREDMERAEARRLQPHYIESFFLEAFKAPGRHGASNAKPRRYEVTHVPAPVRNRDRLIGIGEPVLPRYERIAFEKTLIAPQGQPLAAFVCPGHPLARCRRSTSSSNATATCCAAGRCWSTSATPEPSRACCSILSTRSRTPASPGAASGGLSPSGCSTSRSMRTASPDTSTTRPTSTIGHWRPTSPTIDDDP